MQSRGVLMSGDGRPLGVPDWCGLAVVGDAGRESGPCAAVEAGTVGAVVTEDWG